MSNESQLGTVPKGDESRDAVHVAIAPAQAGEPLSRGCHVKLNSYNKAVRCSSSAAIGVVDPFRSDEAGDVTAGSWFWLCLIPKTITSLRHLWEHPAFPTEPVAVPKKPTKEASEAWLRNFIKHADCPDYETVLAAAISQFVDGVKDYGRAYSFEDFGDNETCLHFNGRDARGDIPPEFWDHVENITGVKCPVRARAFSCSC